MFVEAKVILAKCKSTQRLYGIRIQHGQGNKWLMTWAFPIDENRAKNEGFDREKLKVDCYQDEEFNGCPDCGSKGFVICGHCKKITCYSGEKEVRCAWCGNMMSDIAYRGAVDLTAGDD